MGVEDTITVVEVQETQYGEKAVLDSHIEARHFIKALPFYTMGDYDDYVSEMNENDLPDGAIQAAVDFEFSDELSTHRVWDPDARGIDEGAWMIDANALEEATEFFEFCGFDVENQTNL